VVLDGTIVRVTVTVRSDSSATVGVGVMASIDVAVLGVVEDAGAGFIELPDPEPVTPPVAPAALMRDRALFSLVQAIVVPLELTDGSAKQCWVAGQRPFEVSNCPFTQEAMASWRHVVSPLVQEPVAVVLAVRNWALSFWASRALLSRVVESSDAIGAE